jgi:CheY-like chemotaxis protein
MSATLPPEQPVLIVDDEADSREALGALLEHEGYRVVTAADGQQALCYLQERGAPCLILLDLKMPVMDGWTLLRRLQTEERFARIPVVVISGGLDRRTMARLRGAVGFFAKPVRIEALLAEMEQWCRADGAEQEQRSHRDARAVAQPSPSQGHG